MGVSYFVHKWKERLKVMMALPLSNSSLRFFPPDFSLRDPIVSRLRHFRRQGQNCGLLLLYLEDFHHYFATYPFSHTERLQRHIRKSLMAALKEHVQMDDVIGVKQYGGENFCIFIKGAHASGFEELNRTGYTLRKLLEKKLETSSAAPVHGSLQFQAGAYLFDRDIENTHAAVQSAVHYAQSVATKKLPPHFSRTRQELNRIIHEEAITVLAQPIMCLRQGDVFGWEILTRGPQNTPFHTPTELFEFAYQADLLSKLEFLVMRKALQEIHHRGIKEQVFINITPISLSHPLFLDQLLNELKLYPDILPSQIVLEITERHNIRDYAHMGSIMARYRTQGFRFAVDDAGAGYSSLQSISELIPDIIKIDKSVIQNIDQLSVKQSLLKALLFFAENINCEVIAEGVEREEEADMLLHLKVQMGQGFYFARPQPMQSASERVVQFDRLKEKIQQRQANSA
uniref:EAL domain-containing protein n=1 Tax=Paenibacillus athensensis TaxID=1967502 RepID=A0A4Y8Q2M0_9BACL